MVIKMIFFFNRKFCACSVNHIFLLNSFSSLVISKQPFPKPIKHNTRAQNVETEEPVIVELICAPKASCRAEGNVKAQLMYEEFHARRAYVHYFYIYIYIS